MKHLLVALMLLIPAVAIGQKSDYLSALSVAGPTTITSRVAVTSSTAMSDQPGIVSGLTVRSPSDEYHEIFLRAGLTTDTKNYFAWQAYAGSTDWLMGRDATNNFVLFSRLGASHHMYVYPEGEFDINSEGNADYIAGVVINSEAGSGTGGLQIYSGGPNPVKGFDYSPRKGGGLNLGTATGATTGGLSMSGRLIIAPHTPSSATDTGVAGTICGDADYIYVCTGTNQWKRVAISTWP